MVVQSHTVPVRRKREGLNRRSCKGFSTVLTVFDKSDETSTLFEVGNLDVHLLQLQLFYNGNEYRDMLKYRRSFLISFFPFHPSIF